MPTAPMYAPSPYRNSEIEVNPLMTEEYMGATTVWELPRRVKIYRLLGDDAYIGSWTFILII